ncbi:MAG TPA: SRPBCC family protein [Pseudonocardiaceae bacterium]|jgi:hypothetical protein
MSVVNIHERRFPVSVDKVSALVDALATEDDPLWPRGKWHAIRLDRPLSVGATGGHGPIRYDVAAYVPGQWVRFTFSRPIGFDGFHEFTVHGDDSQTVLRHMIALRLHSIGRLSWPLKWRWLHDALLEDLLDRAEENLVGSVESPARYSLYVRFLRSLPRPKKRPRPAAAPPEH